MAGLLVGPRTSPVENMDRDTGTPCVCEGGGGGRGNPPITDLDAIASPEERAKVVHADQEDILLAARYPAKGGHQKAAPSLFNGHPGHERQPPHQDPAVPPEHAVS